MTVAELIKALIDKGLPLDSEVVYINHGDSGPRLSIKVIEPGGATYYSVGSSLTGLTSQKGK